MTAPTAAHWVSEALDAGPLSAEVCAILDAVVERGGVLRHGVFLLIADEMAAEFRRLGGAAVDELLDGAGLFVRLSDGRGCYVINDEMVEHARRARQLRALFPMAGRS